MGEDLLEPVPRDCPVGDHSHWTRRRVAGPGRDRDRPTIVRPAETVLDTVTAPPLARPAPASTVCRFIGAALAGMAAFSGAAVVKSNMDTRLLKSAKRELRSRELQLKRRVMRILQRNIDVTDKIERPFILIAGS